MVPPPENRYFYTLIKAIAVTIIFIAFVFRPNSNNSSSSTPFVDRALVQDDIDFYDRIQNVTLPFEQWTHLAHVRLAFIICAKQLTEMDSESSSSSNSGSGGSNAGVSVIEMYDRVYHHMKQMILNFNEKHAEKLETGYHETITHMWLHLVMSAFIELLSNESTKFEDLLSLNPELKSFDTSFKYYSKSLLYSDVAKSNFIKPELQSFPMQFISDMIK